MNILISTFQALTDLPEYFAYIFTFALGAVVGSFLNVVIHRIPNDESIVFPNSACPKCQKSIKPYDNIPILSWLLLRGKCRNCKNPISRRYPAVEFLTAFVFCLVYWQIGVNPFLPVALIFSAAIISLIFIDAEHMILPDLITFPLLFFALLIRIIYPIVFSEKYFPDLQSSPLIYLQEYPAWLVSLIGAILGGLFGGGSLWLVGEIWKKFRGVEAMGFGDVKMMFGVGALLGLKLTFLTIFIGAFTGAVAGILVMAKQKDKDFQTQIPFGIFLGIGSIVALLFGEMIISWYLESFVP